MSDTANRLTFHLGIPNAQRLRLVGLTLAALIVSGHLLFNTRTGVHTVFETFGIGADDTEWAAGPDDPPATVTQTATLTQTLQYPGEILQPSGIAWDASGERLLIVTDQAELFAVSRNLDRVFSETTMSRAPLVARQGSVETVTALGSSAIIAGRDHALPTWEATDDYWRRGEALRGEGYAAPMSGDIMAMAADPESGRLFAADEDGGLWREVQPGSGWEPLVLSGATGGARSLQEYRIMGLEFHAERLYALTEYYPNILVINPASGRIERVFALEGLRDQSGLAMLDGQAFITVDHEYDEASPGLMVFDLEG